MVRRLLTGVFQTVVRYTAAVIFLGLLWQAGTTAFGDAVLPSPWATGKLFLTSLTCPSHSPNRNAAAAAIVIPTANRRVLMPRCVR